MRIHHLGKYYWPEFGGMETAAKEIAEAGQQLGHDVRCFVAQANSVKRREENVNGVHVVRLPTYGHVMSAPLSPYWLNLRESDILHIHLPHPTAELAALWALWWRPKGTRFMPYFHAFPSRQGRIGTFWFKNITARLFDRAEAILVSNKNIIHAFPQLQPWSAKFKILPFSTSTWDDKKIQEHLAPRAASTSVIALGRLVKYKGYDILLKAWAKIMSEHPKFKTLQLSIVGIGPEWEYLTEIRRELKLEKQVRMTGACTEAEKAKWLEGASIFVAPSLSNSETFGISMLEAMGCGLPVITTRIPTGVAILAREGKCGAVVTPGNVDELAAALVRMLEDQAERSKAGLANAEFARQNYSWENLLTAYRELLR
ncbi:MAG: glycosyltransferase [Deltaproteobacteria bacterium]|nr:glycosyltransferase [Deltaproteobacteria bacterium]